jgi:hypothetical protein
MKNAKNNPVTVTYTEKKSMFLIVTTGSVTNGGKGYKHQKLTNVHILVFSH